MTSTHSELLNPLSKRQRIQSIDVLRGISVCGILLMNIAGFGLPEPGYGDPTIGGGSTGLNLYVWITNNLFFEGTMRAIFSMLFGAGFIILTSRNEDTGAGLEVADVHYRRVIWLIIFGVIHAYLLLWRGEILYGYGLMGLFLFPFRKLAPKVLFIAGISLILIGTFWDVMDSVSLNKTHDLAMLAEKDKAAGVQLSKESEKALEKWNEKVKEAKPSQEVIQVRIDAMHEGYFSIVKTLAPFNTYMQSSFSYRYDVWDVLSMMLIGMALFKVKIFSAARSFGYYWLMVIVGYMVGITTNIFETRHIINNDFSIMSFVEAGMTYNVGRFFTAMGHIGIVMIICKSGLLGFLTSRLAAVGKMALTNYIMHTIICNIIFLGFGFGMFGMLERYQLYYVVFSIWIFQLILSPLWLKRYNYGPLEWGWRYLIYKQWPKLKDENYTGR
ncbi:MAG: DUF418 domain-containing protein [Cyclobacteriaceae bacterium]|nr:DUF418 domain-containing protein [Cyclobacteriaceae bacterium]